MHLVFRRSHSRNSLKLPLVFPHFAARFAFDCCIHRMAKPKKSNRQQNAASEEEGSGSHPENVTPDTTQGSLYQVLGVERIASQQEIKKAYHRLALQLHPDKNQNDENANEKFQKLQKVMSILGDPEKRKLYDETGCVDDQDLAGDAVQNLCDFLRTLYKEVTEQDILDFEAKYRGSEEEKKDLLDLYTKFKGKMDRVFDWLMCCEPKLDNHRFKDIIDAAIEAGQVKEWKAYRQWGAEVDKTQTPRSPLKRPARKGAAEADLMALISQRQTDRKQKVDSMFSSLVAKYGGSSDQPEEPTEEEFEATRQKMEAQKQSKNKSKRKQTKAR
ncbi:chaperone protein dnaJ 6 isoform X2 [Cryptomeria japonica]|uniref:chaperone protein dnaJ 6 isoform X2 n=1 Tax=Cryptomeria japonica TaxID=3369 RepID=UPI0027DA8511|nr:chaperone protein dnaJ 6 isoform X2 [Cryptomeria japonica]